MRHVSELFSRFFSHARAFSFSYALTEVLIVINREFASIFHRDSSEWLLHVKESYILDWLRRTFAAEIEKYQLTLPVKGVSSTEAQSRNIWVCWLQGEKNAPILVKQMISNIRKRAGLHKVVVISFDNYNLFCSVPEAVETKFRNHQMPIQQFADVLRTCLLVQRGGVWIDGTILLLSEIPEEVFTLPIYNVKDIDGNFEGALRVADSTMYQSYFISSQPHSATYSFILDCLTKYWKTNDTLIDYFLISYLAKIAREQIPSCKLEYSLVPPNNKNCELLHDFLMKRQELTKNDVKKYLESKSWILKLSWKTTYPQKTRNGEPTLFAYIASTVLDHTAQYGEQFDVSVS